MYSMHSGVQAGDVVTLWVGEGEWVIYSGGEVETVSDEGVTLRARLSNLLPPPRPATATFPWPAVRNVLRRVPPGATTISPPPKVSRDPQRRIPKVGTQAERVLRLLAQGHSRLAHLCRDGGRTVMNETSASARIRELRRDGWRIAGQRDGSGKGWVYTLHPLDKEAYRVKAGR